MKKEPVEADEAGACKRAIINIVNSTNDLRIIRSVYCFVRAIYH